MLHKLVEHFYKLLKSNYLILIIGEEIRKHTLHFNIVVKHIVNWLKLCKSYHYYTAMLKKLNSK